MILDEGLVSIVIVNYNGARFLPRCIASIQELNYPLVETIVVDNASTDGSAEWVRNECPGVRLVRKNENLGFAGGVNAGIRVSKGDYILTLNNDAFLHRDFLTRAVAAMNSGADIGMCAAKMLFPDSRINSAGICISLSGAAWDRGMHEEDTGQYRPGEVFGPCAGAALYRRRIFDDIGLFDEDFFLFMEDVDLAFRARLAGWRCIYEPGAVACHVHGGTAGVGSDIAVYYGNRNIIWYPVKDFPIRILLIAMPFLICRNLAVVAYYAYKGKGMVALRSKIDGILGIPKMWEKRRNMSRSMMERDILRQIRLFADIRSR